MAAHILTKPCGRPAFMPGLEYSLHRVIIIGERANPVYILAGGARLGRPGLLPLFHSSKESRMAGRKSAARASFPPLGQGTWFMGDVIERRRQEIRALQVGIELGMTVIDTAEMYSHGRTEELVGEAIAGRRDKVFLISKVLPSNADRKGTKAACERSLARLKTDVIDLYLLHWQGEYPFEETIAGMTDLIGQGKIKAWGVSNFDVEEMETLYALPRGNACAANQILYNLSRRGVEFDLLPWCEKHNLPVIAYSPVEQGRILSNRTLELVAQRHSATPAQIALAWILRRPGITAIPKSGTEEHVRENAGSRDIALSDEDLVMLENTFPAPKRKIELEML